MPLGANYPKWKLLQNEVLINKFWREFLKYGNPGARFWAKNPILLCKSGNWHKIWQKMIFWFQFLNCLYENPEIDKSGGIKFQIFFPATEPYKCHFSSHFHTPSKFWTSGTCRLKIIVPMGIIRGNMLKKVPKIAWLAKNVNKNLLK